MKKRITLYSLLFFGSIGVYSQNLVLNWSFEDYSHCPYAYTQIEFAVGWYASYIDNCCNYQVEYLNACGTTGFQVPDNVWGYQPASTGVAYMAQVTMDLGVKPNYRENIYAQLLSPLVIGETYYISMKVAQTNVSQYSSNNDGIKFSTDTTFAVNNIAAIYSSAIITDSVNWTTIQGCFKADSAYKYIGVGNFFDDAHTNSVQSCPTCLYPHWGYYVDDISVLPMSISGGDTICGSGNSIIKATGGTSYLWSNGSTADSISVSPITTTTYTVHITNPSCTIDTSCTIYVLSGTQNATVSGAPSVCSGYPDTLKASGGTNYKWSNGATSSNIIVFPTSTTSYSVQITTACGTKDTSIAVVINLSPNADISGTNQICKGDSVTLSSSGGGNYLWNTGQTTGVITVKPSSTTIYTLSVTNSYGCKADTIFKVNVVLPGSVSGPASICLGDSITLLATGGGTYKWSNGSTTASVTLNPKSNTTYSVIISNICTDTITKTILVDSAVLFACCDTTITILGEKVILYASEMNNYYWSPNTGGLSCDSCPNPIVSPTVTTTYTVVGTDSSGCKVERLITIDVSSCLVPTIPNVFTPNGDGRNDEFIVNAQSTSDYSIIIYDRWGKEMYKSTNPDVYWDGKNQNDNSMVSDGVYYYIIKYTCNGKSFNKNGYVQAIK